MTKIDPVHSLIDAIDIDTTDRQWLLSQRDRAVRSFEPWKGSWSWVKGQRDNHAKAYQGSITDLMRLIWSESREKRKAGTRILAATFNTCPDRGYPRRQDALAREACFLALDYDDPSALEDLQLWTRGRYLERIGAVLYSSHSDGKPSDHGPLTRFRVVLPLARSVTPNEFKALMSWLHHPSRAGLPDQSGTNISKCWLTARTNPTSTRKPWLWVREGLPLDPDRLPGGSNVDTLISVSTEKEEQQRRHDQAALEKLRAKRKSRTSQGKKEAAQQAYIARALDSATQAVANAGEGQRNETLNREALSIGGLVKAGHITEAEARQAFTQAARVAGLKPKEAADTISSGLGAAQPRLLDRVGELRHIAPARGETFPTSQICEVWEAGTRIDRDPDCVRWFEARGLCPSEAMFRNLARCLPRNIDRPWMQHERKRWRQGWRLLVPVFDSQGRLMSLRAVWTGEGNPPTDEVTPQGQNQTGLVMADEQGRSLLVRSSLPQQWPSDQRFRLWVTGSASMTLIAALSPENRTEHNRAPMSGTLPVHNPHPLQLRTSWHSQGGVLGVPRDTWSDVIADRLPHDERFVMAFPDKRGTIINALTKARIRVGIRRRNVRRTA